MVVVVVTENSVVSFVVTILFIDTVARVSVEAVRGLPLPVPVVPSDLVIVW